MSLPKQPRSGQPLPLTAPSQRLMLVELPAEVLELVALWLPTVPSLCQLQQVCHACRGACASRLAQLSPLLGRFPRMAPLLRAAEAHCARPLDFAAIYRAQEVAEEALLSEEDVLSEEGLPVCSLPPHNALRVTIEVIYKGELQTSWTGRPTCAFSSLREAGPRVRCTLAGTAGCGEAGRVRLLASVYPRVWTTRPNFINELNRMNEEAPDEAAAAWTEVRMRIFLSLGVRSQKIFDAHSDGGDGNEGGWSEMQARVIADLHRPEEGLTVVTICPRVCDDGEVELELLGSNNAVSDAADDNDEADDRLFVPRARIDTSTWPRPS